LIEISSAEFVVSSPVDNRKLESFKISDFDGQKIKALLEEFGAARLLLQSREQEAKNLGG
jgi:hypothetical protein